MEGSSDCGRHGGQHRHESRWGELNVDDGPTRQRSLGSEGASSGTRRSSGWSRLWLWERWHGVVKSSSDWSLDDAATAWRLGRQVSLVASSQSREWERERMEARLGVWKRKKGVWQPARRAAGGGGWCQAGVRWGGGSGRGKRGDEEKPLTGGPVTVLAV
jgi:hypothetical protein